MILTIAFLLGSAIVIYLSCEYFVNSIERVGRRLGVAQSAVGTYAIDSSVFDKPGGDASGRLHFSRVLY